MTRQSFVLGAALLVAACTVGPPAGTPSAAPATEGVPSSVPTSTPRPTPTPVAGVGNCPTDSQLTVAQFAEADPACFGSADVEIRGWLDKPPAIGFEPPGISPRWLHYPSGSDLTTLWEARPEPDGSCPTIGEQGCTGFFWHIDPASGLTLDGPPRWLIVTGHLDDPAAQTCHYVYPEDWTKERADDAEAVATCRAQFVIVSFRDAP